MKIIESSGLAASEKVFSDFVETCLVDPDGLCRSFLNAATLKPWTSEQLSGYDLTFYFKNAPDPGGCLTYENSLMATGEYALSQMARFRVTGEPGAKAAAARAIAAILKVADEGRYYMPGFLPKPFGGVSRARDSHEISPDQYIKSVLALHGWRPYANASQQAAIDQFFIDTADFFIARRFRHAYRHRTIVSADTHHHSLGLFIPICILAAQASGNSRYLGELAHFDEAIRSVPDNPELSNFNISSLLIEGFDLALTAGVRDQRLIDLIALIWSRVTEVIDTEGNGFERTGTGVMLATSESTRAAAAASIVQKYHPGISTIPLALKVLERLTTVSQMTYFLPEDEPRIAAHQRWLPYSINDISVTSWLLAYWRLRELPAL